MRLLAITPPRATLEQLPVGLVDAWVEAGALGPGLAVLLREPGASPREILADRRLGPLREALARREIPLLLSVDPAAMEAERCAELLVREGLAGVQLRRDPSPEQCAQWREALGPERVLGCSAHGFLPSSRPGTSYTCLAPIHAPRTQLPGAHKQPIGLTALRTWSEQVAPLFALGGVSTANAAACLEAGAHGLAGIRLFFGGIDEARHNVGVLTQLFSESNQTRHGPQATSPRRG